jgi:hypothetical protein
MLPGSQRKKHLQKKSAPDKCHENDTQNDFLAQNCSRKNLEKKIVYGIGGVLFPLRPLMAFFCNILREKGKGLIRADHGNRGCTDGVMVTMEWGRQ